MCPSRLPIALLGLSLALAPSAAAKAPGTALTALQAKVTTVAGAKGRLRATVLTAADAHGRRYKGRTLIFDARRARITVADTDGDGRANRLSDVRPRDVVGMQVRLPTSGPLPRKIPVATLMDLTALLSTPTLPQVPGAAPPPGQLPTGG